MTIKLPQAANIEILEAFIYDVKGSKKLSIVNLIDRFEYFENISAPALAGKLSLVDTGANLIASLPIQGFERVEIKVREFGEKEYSYDMRVFKIDSRFTGDRFQYYTLGLISLEALINEGIRVPKTLTGKPDAIVKELLEKYLKVDTSKKQIITDPSAYNIIFNPGKRTPFSIIDSMRLKSVPKGSNIDTKTSKGGDSSGETTDAVSVIPSVDDSSYSKSTGTSGYFFFENRKGFVFKSIDSLCSPNKFNGEPPVAVYTQENIDVGGPPNRKLLSIDFVEEIDILTKLRLGTFSSLICFYNFSTGRYEEYVYSLADSYDKMGHSGSQKGLPYGQKELSKYPTRIMSVLMDHETWFNGTEIASPEPIDGASGSGTNFPDFHKHYVSQSIARVNSIVNQKAVVEVTPNLSLTVGDKIEIRIPNQIPSANRTQEPYDPEHSGIYLISEVNHIVIPKQRKGTTYLTLIRDSYGRPDLSSKVQS
jgi:hypothetical protein